MGGSLPENFWGDPWGGEGSSGGWRQLREASGIFDFETEKKTVFSASNSRNTSLQNQIFKKNGSDSVDVRKADFCHKFSQLNLSPKFWPQI